MYSYFTSDPKTRDKITDLFKNKKVNYSVSTQFTFLFYKNFEKTENLILKNTDVVYLFQWFDKKVRKIDLISLELEV